MPTESHNLEERRAEAKRAMEGEDWRGRRELREKLMGKREAERATAAQDRQAKVEVEQRSTEAAEAQARHLAEVQATEFSRRLDKIRGNQRAISELKEKQINISPVRTLKSDLTRVIKEEGLSISAIALSEQARKRFGLAPAPAPSQPRSLLIPLVVLLILVMVGGGVFLWWNSHLSLSRPITTPPTTEQAFIFAEATASLDLNNANWRTNLSLAAQSGTNWTIKNIVFERGGKPSPWPAVAQALKLELPEALARNLNSQYMFGIYRAGSVSNRFILLKSNFPEQAFAGLIAWEPDLASDLLPVFYDELPTISSNAFTDRLVRNKDARVLIGAGGHPILFYSFLDRETIILTQNEETFVQIFGRFQAK